MVRVDELTIDETSPITIGEFVRYAEVVAHATRHPPDMAAFSAAFLDWLSCRAVRAEIDAVPLGELSALVNRCSAFMSQRLAEATTPAAAAVSPQADPFFAAATLGVRKMTLS